MQDPAAKPINFYNYVSPVTNLQPDQVRKIKKQENMFKFLGGCIILILICVACVISLFVYQNVMQSASTTDNTEVQPTKIVERPRDYADIKFNSKYVQKTIPVGVDAYARPEIDVWNMLFKKAYDIQWDGKLTSPLGFTYKDLNQQELNSYLISSAKIALQLTIPKEKESLFYGDGTQKINGYLKDSRTEYIQFLQDQGFSQKYINEFKDYVFPDSIDKIVYPTTGGSTNKPAAGDYSRKLIFVDPQDIYENYLDLKNTIYGKKLSDADLVAASSRVVMYNQLGYAFMQAYINQHVSSDVKNLGKENMWLLADTNFLQYSTDYYWAWPYNKDINDSRFARGLMLKAFTAQYKLNTDQASDFFDIIVQKDNLNINKLHDLGVILHQQYTDLLMGKWDATTQFFTDSVFGKYQGSKTQTESLNLILPKLNRIPKLMGYFNPMEEKDLRQFKN